ncbi:melatonin receptor type 1C [Brachyhypopomus gauderio]|uniref:melatonin receptor type 1C n=1 Tax=Brachyhypopomus gauderio TaxID=698409 RepID=UPI004040FDC5
MAVKVNLSCTDCLVDGANSSNLTEKSTSPGTGALAGILIFTIAADLIGNLLVIFSVYRNKKLRTAGNIFVVSLSVADLVVALYPYPLALHALLHGGWMMGAVQCQLSGFVMGLSVIGSVFNITAIAINRYCYICHSLHYRRIFTQRNTVLFLGLTWALTVLTTLPNFLVGSLTYDPRVFSCTFSQAVSTSYTVAVVFVHFLVPLAVVSFCYLRIWVLVIRVKGRVSARPGAPAAHMRSFVTMFVVFVLFAVCWAPLNLIGLVVALAPAHRPPHVPESLFVSSYFLAYFNSCLNAIVYGLLNQNFRGEYKRILLTLCAPRAIFTDSSKCNTDTCKSKASPMATHNNPVEAYL